MSVSPQFNLTGFIDALTGSSTGYISLTLVNPPTNGPNPARVAGTGMIAQRVYQTPIGASFSVTVFGNDQITPETWYDIRVFDSSNNQISIGSYSLIGSGGDLSSLTPINVPTVTPPNPPTQVGANTIYSGPPSGGSAVPTFRHGVPNDIAGVDTVQWVGGDTPQRVSGAFDIGKEIQAANDLLIANGYGGLIYVASNPAGTGGYNFSTPVTLGAIDKPVSLKGLAPAGFNPTGMGPINGSFTGLVLNYTGTTGQTSDAVTQVLPSLSVSGLSVSGGVVTLTGTFTGCGNNLLANQVFTGRNFSNSGNNTAFTISTSTTTTITGVANGSQVTEASPPGTANIYNRSRAIYVGTYAGGASNGYSGRMVNITGFTAAAGASGIANNGYFGINASTATGLLVFNNYASAETHAATAVTLQPAITLVYGSNTTGDGFVPNYIEDIVLQNNSSAIQNFGNGYDTIGIDYSQAGGVTFNRVAIQGFGIGEVFNAGGVGNASNTWGAARYQFTLSHNNVAQVFINGMENYNWFGGKNIVNGIGVYDAGGDIPGTLHWHGVSFDSNLLPIRDLCGSSDFTLMACHLENNGLSTASAVQYAYIETGNFTMLGGRILDDQTSGTAPASWINVGPTITFGSLKISGVQIFSGGRFPSTAAFVGSSAVNVDVVNGNSAMTNIVSGPANQTINLTQANQAILGCAIGPQLASSKFAVNGAAPSVGAVTGLGSTGTATIQGGSDSAFFLQLNPSGSSIGSSGTAIVNFSSAFLTTNSVIPVGSFLDVPTASAVWNARATVKFSAQSKTGLTVEWDNNSVALTGGSNYFIAVQVTGY